MLRALTPETFARSSSRYSATSMHIPLDRGARPLGAVAKHATTVAANHRLRAKSMGVSRYVADDCSYRRPSALIPIRTFGSQRGDAIPANSLSDVRRAGR